MMFRHRSDLPLGHDTTSHFLPGMVGAMVFLAAIALAGAMVLQMVMDRWQRDVSGTLTVQVMPVTGEPARAATETGRRVDAAVEVLLATPGVGAARPLDQQQIAELLEPWLGSREVLVDLPVPRLIDVTIRPGFSVDLVALGSRLTAVAPGTSLDDHQVWLSKLVRLGHGLELLALAVVGLVAAAMAATVVYATRTGLAVHRPVIEVLHLIGAQDDYIARQFAHRSLVLGLRGGLVGLALAGPVLGGIGWLTARMEGALVPDFSLGPLHWAALAALPVAAGYLAMLTARITVHRTLARMP
ncbi:MAG: cell division protein [Alphaproteobacteria bacterium]